MLARMSLGVTVTCVDEYLDLFGGLAANGPVSSERLRRLRPPDAVLFNDDSRARFEAKVYRTPACWFWVGALDRDGYGRFSAGRGPQAYVMAAHRWAFEAYTGPIPHGEVLSHACDMTLCCRPDHLRPVPQHANVTEMVIRNRHGGRYHCGTRVDIRGHRQLAVAIRTLLLTDGFDQAKLEALLAAGDPYDGQGQLQFD